MPLTREQYTAVPRRGLSSGTLAATMGKDAAGWAMRFGKRALLHFGVEDEGAVAATQSSPSGAVRTDESQLHPSPASETAKKKKKKHEHKSPTPEGARTVRRFYAMKSSGIMQSAVAAAAGCGGEEVLRARSQYLSADIEGTRGPHVYEGLSSIAVPRLNGVALVYRELADRRPIGLVACVSSNRPLLDDGPPHLLGQIGKVQCQLQQADWSSIKRGLVRGLCALQHMWNMREKRERMALLSHWRLPRARARRSLLPEPSDRSETIWGEIPPGLPRDGM